MLLEYDVGEKETLRMKNRFVWVKVD